MAKKKDGEATVSKTGYVYPEQTRAETRALVEMLRKKFPDARVLGVASQEAHRSTPIPSGSVTFDWAVGTGGFMPRKIYEIYGPPSCGKTLLCNQAIRQFQMRGYLAVYVDIECSHDEQTTLEWMAKQGVDIYNLIYVRDTAEITMNIVHSCAEDERVGIIVVDSIGTMILEEAAEGTMNDQRYKSLANLMGSFTGKFNIIVKQAALVIINQVRAPIGQYVPSGQQGKVFKTSGGYALQHNAHVRIEMVGKKIVDKPGGEITVIGNQSTIKTVKNKLSTPGKVGTFNYYWDTGLDYVDELANLAMRHNIPQRSGAWFTYEPTPGRKIQANGINQFIMALRDPSNTDLQAALYQEIMHRRTNSYDVNPEELEHA